MANKCRSCGITTSKVGKVCSTCAATFTLIVRGRGREILRPPHQPIEHEALSLK